MAAEVDRDDVLRELALHLTRAYEIAEELLERCDDDACGVELGGLLNDTRGALERLLGRASRLDEGAADPPDVQLLNRLLQIEYDGIIGFHRHARTIRDPQTARMLVEFGEREVADATWLAEMITARGGRPRWKLSYIEKRRESDALGMLESHQAAEAEVVRICREKLADPSIDDGLQTILRTIVEKEQAHSDKLQEIIDRLRREKATEEGKAGWHPGDGTEGTSREPPSSGELRQ